jgi:hypothetical protein
LKHDWHTQLSTLTINSALQKETNGGCMPPSKTPAKLMPLLGTSVEETDHAMEDMMEPHGSNEEIGSAGQIYNREIQS